MIGHLSKLVLIGLLFFSCSPKDEDDCVECLQEGDSLANIDSESPEIIDNSQIVDADLVGNIDAVSYTHLTLPTTPYV